jgi:hypothetical protein
MVNGVFRDKNGINMPFLKKRIAKRFYTNMMIDEFSNMLIKAGPFDFSFFFKVPCPNLSLLIPSKSYLFSRWNLCTYVSEMSVMQISTY